MADAVSSGLWGAYQIGTATSKIESQARVAQADLDRTAFLKLLVAQMKNQDPLNPTEDKEFLAQMAQFTSLEQMQNLNSTVSQQQGFSLIGKTIVANVYGEETKTYTEVVGRVDSVMMQKGETFLFVGEKQVKLSEVTDVYEDMNQAAAWRTLNTNVFTQQSLSLIGKTVQAVILDSSKNPTDFVEGKVDYVKFTDGSPVLVVGDKLVYPGEVISVADKAMVIGKSIIAMIPDEENVGEFLKVPGSIESIKFAGKDAYVVVNGKEVLIDNIDELAEALRHVGEDINVREVSGTIEAVVIKNKKLYYKVGDDLVDTIDTK